MTAARSTYNRFAQSTSDPNEREFIEAGALWFTVCEANHELFETIQQRFRTYGGPINPEIRLRVSIVAAYLASRRGDYPAALGALDRATHDVRTVNSPIRNILDATAMFVDFAQHGVSVIERRAPDLLRKFTLHDNSVYLNYFVAYGLLASGKWLEGEAWLHDALRRTHVHVDRLRLLGLIAMIAALRGTETPYDVEIDREAQLFSNGTAGIWYTPLAAWWSARIATTHPQQAQLLFLRALERCATPLEPLCRLPLVGFAIAAKRLGRPMLEHFVSNSPWVDRTPVNQSEFKLALALAQDGLGNRNQKDTEIAIETCESLGLHLHAMISRNTFSPKDTTAANQLAKLGIYQLGATSNKSSAAQETPKLTTRERHVASVVAEGLTNRDIAERLVLSERTIEAHVANIFNKLNVSSRTQIAAWYLRSTAAG